MFQDIWANRIVASTPITYAKSAIAMAPGKVEELNAVSTKTTLCCVQNDVRSTLCSGFEKNIKTK